MRDIESAIEAALNGQYIPSKHRNISNQLDEALRFIDTDRKEVERKVAKAKAELLPHTTFTTKAVASQTTALQVPLHLTIAPLDVANGNREGIPVSEADNVLASAKNSPITAAFDGKSLGGHRGTSAIGPITNVRLNENNVIVADGYLWREQNPDLVEYIQAQGEVYSSWEIFYDGYEMRDGIKWLTGVLFSALTLVSNPSYGTLTPVRITS